MSIVELNARKRIHRPMLNGVSINGESSDNDRNKVEDKNNIYKSNIISSLDSKNLCALGVTLIYIS